MSYSNEWFKIMNEVKHFQDDNRYVWYRGINNSEYKLNSGMYREHHPTIKAYIAHERNRYEVFKRMGHLYLNEDDWSQLFVMQHHGVKTRLLDWTESFAVALYFALLNPIPGKEPVIWMLSPLRLNKLSLNKASFKSTNISYEDFFEVYIHQEQKEVKENELYHSVATYPLRNSSRIVAQHGMFTIQGAAGTPLEEEHDGHLVKEGSLKKIAIPEEVMRDAHSFLRQAGVSHFSMFPDLDGLSRHVNSL
ncbi:FRG domain-containing protein [Terribacillus aidingensis]|uniref:FRG domain-containing protein n=1 Tax=Terribacillus aidingensis TaxID=586416 RepID=A0A285NLU4_9BACI|nr:FRG domain-containing protein [Terribacillus aidingensis]SNZ09893.1 FRG domain-containing protein [Terribacillus aidingensis]